MGRRSRSVFRQRKQLCKALHNALRDAKQAAGLNHSQARDLDKLYFHFNASLTTVNIAKIIHPSNKMNAEEPFSIANYKLLYHNAFMLNRFIEAFGVKPKMSCIIRSFTLLSEGSVSGVRLHSNQGNVSQVRLHNPMGLADLLGQSKYQEFIYTLFILEETSGKGIYDKRCCFSRPLKHTFR